MSRETSEAPLAIISKNGREQVQVRLGEYRGSHFVDVRIFAPYGDNPDEPLPTKKGLALNVSKIDELIDALAQTRAEALRLGLLGNGRTA